jgi:hypothetical protein
MSWVSLLNYRQTLLRIADGPGLQRRFHRLQRALSLLEQINDVRV